MISERVRDMLPILKESANNRRSCSQGPFQFVRRFAGRRYSLASGRLATTPAAQFREFSSERDTPQAMFSPSDLMKRVGVGGGLVPFFKCVCVYFLGAAGAGPSAAVAASKCAPVLCLLAVVLLLPAQPDQDHERRRYARRIALGLAASALGDALLVWPQQLVGGMGAFALAHVCYMSALGARARAPRRGAAALLLGAAALYVRALAPPPPLRLLVPLYAALLAGTAWRALATLPPLPPRPAACLAAPAGALLFLLSDAILGYSLFGGAVPYKQALVMSTYYLGQLGLALSALLPPQRPTLQ